MVGYMVGLGAIWRFPYLCFRWGGILFLIPYFLGMILVGIPMATMEVLLGQIHQQGSADVFRAIHPRLEGIGYNNGYISAIFSYYYNVMIAWSLVYVCAAFVNPLPWSMQRTQPDTKYKICPDLFITSE